MPAERAHQLGLVNHLAPPGETLTKAVDVAHRIARNAPLSIAAVKRVVNERTAYGDQDAFRQQDHLVAPVLASHDAQEGAHAFTEKRPPHWEGR
ncbi:enoyl-CoA hydratase-related protein [Streptomyces atratus]|uniref:enoyl-CoA hydratase-related protein n=1 Tax=Streptomyces atratus TaxID=1893 RepID=UPI002254F8B6|nr:enoyl-CoA hydratase-related protein [Streptomyces atratus]MCX5346021.1 enoyl-CoA hydratase-related protein [Streptomyces atratus]